MKNKPSQEVDENQTIGDFIRQEIHEFGCPTLFQNSGVTSHEFERHFNTMIMERLGITDQQDQLNLLNRPMSTCPIDRRIGIVKTLNYIIRIKILGILQNKLPPGTIVNMKYDENQGVVEGISETGVSIIDDKGGKKFTVSLSDAFAEWGDTNENETHPPYVKTKLSELKNLSLQDQEDFKERIDEILQYINKHKPKQEEHITSLEELSQKVDIVDRIGMIHVHHLFRLCYELQKGLEEIDTIDHYRE